MGKPNRFIDAAVVVLEVSDGPLTAAEIWERSKPLRGDWYDGGASTPGDTQAAQLGIYARLGRRGIVRSEDRPYRYWLAGRGRPEGDAPAATAGSLIAVPPKGTGLRAAVHRVLAESPVPLSPPEAWQEIERRGLFATKGNTPEATVGAFLYKATKDELPGWTGIFRRVAEPGEPVRFALADASPIKGKRPRGLMPVGAFFEEVPFVSETDAHRGLEPLVNRDFFRVLPFEEEACLLFAENRTFLLPGANGVPHKQGVAGLPDALLVERRLDDETGVADLAVHLVEYECLGPKADSVASAYFGNHILPQLNRFGLAFSTGTDRAAREACIAEWCRLVLDRVAADEGLAERVRGWMDGAKPGFEMQRFSEGLQAAFRRAVSVTLVLDVLPPEREAVLAASVGAFPLPEKGRFVAFACHRVRLVRDGAGEYGLVRVRG